VQSALIEEEEMSITKNDVLEILNQWREKESCLRAEGAHAVDPLDVFADAAQTIEMARDAEVATEDLGLDEKELERLIKDAQCAQPYSKWP
jgi:hypothetical protein